MLGIHSAIGPAATADKYYGNFKTPEQRTLYCYSTI